MIFNQVFNSQNLIRRLPLLIPPPLFFSLDIDMCDEKRKKKKEEEWRGTFFVFASCSNEIEISLMLVQRT